MATFEYAPAPESRAVVDLPYAVVRRHANDAALPPWMEEDLADSVRKLLTAR